jgi:predicted nucleotide-binding protein
VLDVRAEAFNASEAERDYKRWDQFNRTLVFQSFSTPHEASGYSGPVRRSGFFSPALQPEPRDQQREILTAIQGKIEYLSSLRDRLDLFIAPSDEEPPEEPVRPRALGSEVFLVHGHDGARPDEVARVLGRLTGAEPIILHEQDSRSNTIIEKLERHAMRAGFAVALLTPDDEGRERAAPGEEPAGLRPRGRQNVVFEAGYFVGQIGRERTALLFEVGVELPSDLDGIVYIELDDRGAWRVELGRELRAAGIDADLNQLA